MKPPSVLEEPVVHQTFPSTRLASLSVQGHLITCLLLNAEGALRIHYTSWLIQESEYALSQDWLKALPAFCSHLQHVGYCCFEWWLSQSLILMHHLPKQAWIILVVGLDHAPCCDSYMLTQHLTELLQEYSHPLETLVHQFEFQEKWFTSLQQATVKNLLPTSQLAEEGIATKLSHMISSFSRSLTSKKGRKSQERSLAPSKKREEISKGR